MRCYIEPSEWNKEEVTLSAEEAHHATHVLRATPDVEIAVFNGRGGIGTAKLIEVAKKHTRVRFIKKTEQHRPQPDITLIQAVIREQKMDLVVQKGTELGVSVIIPVITQNAVVRLTEKKAETRKIRWEKIALSAAKQSGAVWIPEIMAPVPLADLPPQKGNHDLLLVCSLENVTTPLSNLLTEKLDQKENIGVFVGPEGDFTAREMDQIRADGAIPVSLGKSVLRAETAALYILSVLRYVLNR